MKLVLFGGIQGVGKTTLLSWLERKYAGRIIVLDAGELFRRYAYAGKTKTADEVEELIADTLRGLPDDSVAVAHWHYAVRRPGGFIPQISFVRLKHLAESGKIKNVVLITLTAPPGEVQRRRAAEDHVKRRDISELKIREEMEMDEQFLRRHKELFSRALGENNVIATRFMNTDLESIKRALDDFFVTMIR